MSRGALRHAALAAMALAAIAAIGPAPAEAARVHPLLLSEKLPNEGSPVAVAVNSASHHFYAVSPDGHVYDFEENGNLNPVHPELTGDSLLGAFKVAVDNSGGAHAGYIYLVKRADTGAPVFSVQQFDPQGEATAVTITESAVPPNGSVQGGGLPPVINNGSFEPRSVTVDDSGNVFVTDTAARAIDVFKPTGEFERQIASTVSLVFPEGIAIDGPDIYVSLNGPDGPVHSVGPGLIELDAATGECVALSCTPVEPDPAPITGVAVDAVAATIFTTGLVDQNNGAGGGKLMEYDAATGSLLGVTQPKALMTPVAIAVDQSSHKVIVADIAERTVNIFGPVEILPDVETLAPEEVTDRSATLKGKVGAAEVAGGATCIFQYADATSFSAHGFEGAASAPCEPAGPFTGSAMNQVEAKVSGLRGGTTYHERILGTNLNGANPGEDVPFEAKGPSVTNSEVSEVGVGEATLKAKVDPNGSGATYRFQYLTQAAFEASGWTGATEVPAGGEDLGSGSAAVAVEERIEGLQVHTAYRFRVLATSTGGPSAGETVGEEIAFTTFAPPTTGLPDARRYEQASPLDKSGTNVQGGIDEVQASLDGDGITFFSNAGLPGGEGAQDFPTFLASRAPDSSGWSTRGLLPPATYGPRATVLGWTEDLKESYGFSANPTEGGRLLRRQSSDGSVSETATIDSPNNPFAYAGSSQGGSVALLETKAGGLLPNDLAGKQNVYAYGRETGTLALAGVMNDGTVPPGGAIAGPYRWFENGSLTTGGSIGGYYTQPIHAISADGTRVFFTAGGTGQLYVRLNPLAPQSAMAGGACSEAAKACTVRVSAPATGVTDPATPAAFLGASGDGRLVYFSDTGKLTADSTAGAGSDLYRYDVETGALLDLTPDPADGNQGARVQGMLGIGGPGGEDAYFVAAGKLASGTTQAPAGETNLYATHGTAISFIARLGTSTGTGGEALAWVPTSATANPAAHAARVSADGQTLLFRSKRKLTPYDNRGIAEIYLYRTGEGISCISCNPSGQAAAWPAGVQSIPQLFTGPSRTYTILTRNLSADGKRAFFDTAERLLPSDRNHANDVYEWEAPDPAKPNDTCTVESPAYVSAAAGCIYLISSGAEGAEDAFFGDADEEGENAFFFTSAQLVAQDRDELVDVYDARVGGGIAAQEAEPAVPCEGEAGCRGSAPSRPSSSSPGSTSFTGPGNPKPPAPCPKGKVRKKGRCVAKQQHHKKHKNTKRHGRGKGGRR